MKTETIEQFLARGGQIKKVTKLSKKRYNKKAVEPILEIPEVEIDMSLIPENLKITLGFK